MATFVRKRDPRFKKYQVEEQQRREAIQAEQKARAQREKEELQAQLAAYKEQEWEKVTMVLSEDEQDEDNDGAANDETDFYCVVCDKFYKSEQQYVAHESSRKHVKLAQAMKQEMMADDEAFDFTSKNTANEASQPIPDDDDDDETPSIITTSSSKKKKKNKKGPRFGFEQADDDANEEDEISQLTAALELEQRSRRRRKTSPGSEVSAAAAEDQANVPQKESAKAKREKRKEKKKQKEEKEKEQGVSTNVRL